MDLVKQLHLEGFLEVTEERWDRVMAALPEHIELTLAEEGCLSFDLTPCPDVPYRLLVTERFVDRAAFDIHRERNQTSGWFEITEGLSREYEITEVQV